MKRSREIVEILADVVARTKTDCRVVMGGPEIDCPEINYTFGNAQYIKDHLDELSSLSDVDRKFPLIALFCPFVERRDVLGYYTSAKVRVLIACATDRQYSNEQRCKLSFENILRPIYRRFLEALKEDGRFEFGYDAIVEHEYSENYSYGRYGAVTGTGEEVSDPIDAINITNLKLTVKLPSCR